MKMPTKKQMCGACGEAVLRHKNSVNIDGQLFHRRKCWPKFRKSLRKEARRFLKYEETRTL